VYLKKVLLRANICEIQGELFFSFFFNNMHNIPFWKKNAEMKTVIPDISLDLLG